MAEVVVFHHAHGLTAGMRSFVADLEAAGHLVHLPDLYEGRVFATLDDGVAHAEEVGFEEIIRRGEEAVAGLASELVYAGFSLGVLPAQRLAQTRPGAKGALLYHSGIPTSAFGTPWPKGVPLQIHAMEGDEWAELDVCEELAAEIPEAELFVYPGTAHLFADSSLSDHHPEAAGLLMERTLAFLTQLV